VQTCARKKQSVPNEPNGYETFNACSAFALQVALMASASSKGSSRTAKRPRPKAKSVRKTNGSGPPPQVQNGGREDSGRDYSIAAIGRALDLLEALARTGPASLAVLADAAGCTRTNAFRLLRTLEARGFAIQETERGIWRLGARWSALGHAANEQGAMAATAMPFLASLGKTCGENVYLRVREGMESETVAIFQTDPSLRIYSEVGQRRALHAGSSRLLLAYAPEAVQTQVLTQRLPRFTPATRTDSAWIAADLQRIRTRGYLVTSDEVVPGAVSIAAPVRDAAGQVVAVLFISAPSNRMRPPRPRSLLPQGQHAAVRLSAALGHSSGTKPVGDPAQEHAPATAVRPAVNGGNGGTPNGNQFVIR
jgi:DNA-binding IclR family transcriptional regulator